MQPSTFRPRTPRTSGSTSTSSGRTAFGRTGSGRTGLRLSERISLAFLALVVAASAIGVAVSGAFALANALFGDTVRVDLVADMPVSPEAARGPATIVSGTFDSATVVVDGLDFGSRAWLAGGILVTALMYLAVAATIVFVCEGLFRGRPFARPMTWVLATSSVILVGGGLIGTGLTTAAKFTIAAQLNVDPTHSVFPMAGAVDFAPLLVGLGLAVIAAAFELGERLQRETVRLQRETEGLV